MASFHEYKRRSLLPLGLGVLALYYVLVFVPLSHRVKDVNEPLQRAWRKLANTVEQGNATSLDFLALTNQLQETRQALAIVDIAKQKAAARLELSPALRAKLTAPFQLVDYQNERSKQIDDLYQKARQQKISVEPAVYIGFPEHTTETQDPAMLWAALSFTDELLEAALRAKVSAIHSLEVPLQLTNTPSSETLGRWDEVPIQLEFTAPADNVLRMLQGLPAPVQVQTTNAVPDMPQEGAPLFIERLIIRKQSPEKSDEVRVWLRVLGFALRE